jgi:DNA-binding NtrC family response regulator
MDAHFDEVDVGDRETAEIVAADPVSPETLALVVEHADGRAARVPLPSKGTVVLGGEWAVDGVESETRIAIGDPTVSARHARIEIAEGRARIVDLGSRNGTWLGGARVEAAALTVGACAIVGRSAIALEEIAEAHEPQGIDDVLPGAVGRSPAMRALARRVHAYAALSAPTLIRGESGSGKEVVARALHAISPRKNGPFVAINLGALPRELAEGELFGHERGAFTGAMTTRAGVFELADRGTLLLDELGELPLDMQAKLLRVLETGEVRRLGARDGRKVDVRVVAATWAPLDERIAQGTFREDLYHRVAVLMLDVPPLRDRRGDVPAIAQAMLDRHRHELGVRVLSPAAASRLSAEAWPGNVRELRNVIVRAAAHASGDVIEVADVARALGPKTTSSPPPPRVQTKIEMRNALDLVRAHGGSVAAAARACGLPRETLRDWVRAARKKICCGQ